jgi:hypothetical protein
MALGAAAFLSCSGAFPSPPHATQTASELRSALLRNLNKVESFEVAYRGESLLDEDAGKYVHREVKCKQPFWLYHHGAHGTQSVPWQEDIRQQKAWIMRSVYFNEFPLRRTYFFNDLPSTAPLPGSLQNEIWFQFSGWWCLGTRPAPRLWNLVPTLDVVGRSNEYSIVRELQEQIDGHWCHVLERKGVDALWLCHTRGCCLMKRVAIEPESGRLFGVLELSDHKEVAAGVWAPGKIRNRQYLWVDGEERLTNDFVLKVIAIAVNNVALEQFDFHPRKGSISYHAEKAQGVARQTEPGGLDYLDEISDRLLRVYGHPSKSLLEHDFVIVLEVLVIVVAAAYVLRSVTSARRQANTVLPSLGFHGDGSGVN